jgi:hypothetical protein
MLLQNDPLLIRLGSPVSPFERRGFKKSIEAGEDIIFVDDIITIGDRHIPKGCLRCDLSAPIYTPDDHKYLWIIDQKGLRVILERTSNPDAVRGYVCHTNITGGGKALQGGELWFDFSGTIYLNYKSGRYGANSEEHREAVLEYFQRLGFTVVQLPSQPF